jgi:hypothetical protein
MRETLTNAYSAWLAEVLESQAHWRSLKAEDWPDDERNARSSRALTAAAEYARGLDDSSPPVRPFVKLSELARACGMTGEPEHVIGGAEVAGRFWFQTERELPREPQTHDFDRLIAKMHQSTLESYDIAVLVPGDDLDDDGVSALFAYIRSHGVEPLFLLEDDD